MQLVSFFPSSKCSSIPGQNGLWEYHSLSFKCPELDCDYRCIRFNSFERHILKYHNARSVQDYKPDDFIDYDTITYGTQEECRKLARRKKLTWEPGKLKTKKMKGKERYSEDNENEYEEMDNEMDGEGDMEEEAQDKGEEGEEQEQEQEQEQEEMQEQKVQEGKNQEQEEGQQQKQTEEEEKKEEQIQVVKQEEPSGNILSNGSKNDEKKEDESHNPEVTVEK